MAEVQARLREAYPERDMSGSPAERIARAFADMEANRPEGEADYLVDALPDDFDVATLIYYDFCALAPGDRARLLGRIHDLLEPGGLLALDLAGPGAFAEVADRVIIEPRLMDGFFAAGDYVGIHRTDVYEDEELSLDRFAVFERDEAWVIWNWVQYFTPERAAAELNDAGFMVRAVTSGLDGTHLAADSRTLGVIAQKT